jgi:hypothetical protein
LESLRADFLNAPEMAVERFKEGKSYLLNAQTGSWNHAHSNLEVVAVLTELHLLARELGLAIPLSKRELLIWKQFWREPQESLKH